MKKALPIVLFLAFTTQLCAQMLNQNWATVLTNNAGTAYEELAIVEPHANGTIVAGKSTSPMGYDMYVAGYDNNAVLLWEKYIDTPNNGEFTHLVADGAGNYYLMGFEVLAQFFDRRVHLVKINSAGEILWHSVYSGPENIHAWAKDLNLSNEKLHICGVEVQPDGFDSGFVAQFDLEGNLVWDNDFNPGWNNELTSLAVAPNGNITAVGYADGGYALYAIQYDSNGSTNWTFPDTFTGDEETWFSDIKSDDEGNLYTMITETSGVFEQSVLTQKRTTDFEVIWEHNFDNGGLNEGRSISLGSDASVYAFIEEEVNFDNFARVIKLSSSGGELFSVSDEIGNGTSFVQGVLSANDEVFIGLESLDSFGITSYTSNGTHIASVLYDQSQMDYLTDLALFEDRVAAVAKEAQGYTSALISLSATDLTEQYYITTSGDPLPDARPGKIVTNGTQVWISSSGDSGPTGTFTISSLSPLGDVQWEHSISYPSFNPEFLHLQPDGNGNIIGLYQNNQTTQTGYYGLIKLDSEGNEVFNVYVDDAAGYIASALSIDNDGNTYVAGYNQTEKLMFVERYDASGNLQWQVDYESPSPTFPYSEPLDMHYTDQGKLVIAASHKGANNINDLHLFQYLDNGTLEWHGDVINQTGNNVDLFGMEIESNGDIYVFGSSGFGFVAAQFLTDGTPGWSYLGTTIGTQSPQSMARDEAGNVYLCFSSASDANFKKLDSAGNLLNENSITTNSSGAFYYPYECAMINNQLVALGDHLFSQFGTVSFQMVLSSNLEPLYIAIDSVETAQIRSASLDQNGNFYGAYMTGDLSLGKGARTVIVKKFSMDPLGISDHLHQAEMMKIFPNPSKGDFEIALSLAQPGSFQVSIRDIHGRLIQRFTPEPQSSASSTKQYSLPRSLARGIYLVELRTSETSIVKRIVLE